MTSLLAPILALALAAARGEAAPGTIGEAPFAAAGSQAAPLQPDEAVSPWRGGLATGVAARTGGMRLSSARENSHVLLFFAGQADGLWG